MLCRSHKVNLILRSQNFRVVYPAITFARWAIRRFLKQISGTKLRKFQRLIMTEEIIRTNIFLTFYDLQLGLLIQRL